MRTLAVMNQKGGTGKTTTSVTLSALLASRGQRTLLIDLDPQGHAGLALGVPEQRVRATMADVLSSPDPHHDGTTNAALWDVRPNLSIATSGPALSTLESSGSDIARTAGRERRLRSWLLGMHERFDVCLVDCSPAIGLLTFNALIASSAVLVPIETSYFALRGAERQIAMIDAVRRRTNSDLETWVLPTMHVEGEVPAERILALLQHRYRACIAPVPIRRDPSVAEAQTLGVPMTEHKPEASASRDYQVVADWITGRIASLSMMRPAPNPYEGVVSAGEAPKSRAAELADRTRLMSREHGTHGARLPVCTLEPVPPVAFDRSGHHEEAGGAGAHRPGGTDDGPRSSSASLRLP